MSIIAIDTASIDADRAADEAAAARVAELDALARELHAYGVRTVPGTMADAWQALADLGIGGVRCHAA